MKQVIGRCDSRYLIDNGDGTGYIYDVDSGTFYPPHGIVSLYAKLPWETPTDIPEDLMEILLEED